MFLEINANCNKGNVRARNEDIILVGKEVIRDSELSLKIGLSNKDRFVIAVADGMGGHRRGDLASKVVVQDLSTFFYNLPANIPAEELPAKFESWVEEAHANITWQGISSPELADMGTTLVAFIVYEKNFFWINCGDSRIYRLRSSILSQLSKDHSLAAITGNSSIPSNIITNSIGVGDSVYADIKDITSYVYDQDSFLLCSDGLSDTLDDDKIEDILLHATVGELVEHSLQAGAKDNISAALVKVSF